MVDKAPETYPGNSNTDRKIEEKKVEKVITGGVKTQKKGLGRKFMSSLDGGDDTETIKTYLWWDVLVPAAKDLISDMVTSGVEMFLYGSTKGSRTTRNRGYSNIDYSRRSRVPAQRPTQQYGNTRQNYSVQRRAIHNFDDIILETRGEAELVLSQLAELVEMYEQASVADLYDMIGVSSSFVDNKYGWRNVASAGTSRVRGGYILNLPRVEELD